MEQIAIFGVPRSGTSWLGEIFNSSPNVLYRYQPLFSYAHKGYLTPECVREDVDAFFERMAECDDEFTNQLDKRKAGAMPVFEKASITHVVIKEVRYLNLIPRLLEQSSEIKLVLIVRDPISVIASWFNAPREFRKDLGWKIEDEWRLAVKKNQGRPEEYNGYEKWKEAYLMFHKMKQLYSDQIWLVKYEDLVGGPFEAVEEAFDFLGLNFCFQTEGFLRESVFRHNEDPYSVFKAKGQNRSGWLELPKTILRDINADMSLCGINYYK